jgi:hypothetical protein
LINVETIEIVWYCQLDSNITLHEAIWSHDGNDPFISDSLEQITYFPLRDPKIHPKNKHEKTLKKLNLALIHVKLLSEQSQQWN